MECIHEFGPHTDHDDCERMLDVMRGGIVYDEEYNNGVKSYTPRYA